MTEPPRDRDAQLREATDGQLATALDSTIADMTLAEKYEHNAHLRPAIRARYDAIKAEQARRAEPPRDFPSAPRITESEADRLIDAFANALSFSTYSKIREARVALRVALLREDSSDG